MRGGSLGAVHVGMVEALLDHGCRADMVVGASIGAINGAYFACHPGPEGVEGLRTLWREFRRERHMPVRGVLDWLWSRTGVHILDPTPLREFVLAQLRGDEIEHAELPCHVVATAFAHGGEVVLSAGPWGDAIMASCAIPGVYPPVRIGERLLVDGGMCNNTPISVAVDRGAERIIVLPTGTACASLEPPVGPVEIAVHALMVLINQRLVQDFERFRYRCAIRIIPPVCPLKVHPLDFSKSGELIDMARNSTSAWLRGGGLDLDTAPPQVVPHFHDATGAVRTD
ncbi:MAG: patatin-like phospholipase family protein [Myxococcales bacterium]|nr:patatin-like phospholipase family protein [Myxococcales bacterium]